jgi:hypothetical protein
MRELSAEPVPCINSEGAIPETETLHRYIYIYITHILSPFVERLFDQERTYSCFLQGISSARTARRCYYQFIVSDCRKEKRSEVKFTV